MSQTLAALAPPRFIVPASLRASLSRVDRWHLGLACVALLALALRLAGAEQQSAYMDEGTYVLTGRMLLEQHAVYAEALSWAYGSYLWPLLAGLADELGGLPLVRGLTALCSVITVVATSLAALRLAPATLDRNRRWGVALLAGGIMALAPTAIGVGRFGTYDALAGAGFMLGVSLITPVGTQRWRVRLLLAAGLLFVAFLAKYLVAVYFPFLCVYVALGSGRRLRTVARNVVWFALPLAVACAAYLIILIGPLLTLLSSSLRYSDLKSADPLREYVWTRPELWLLALAAGLAWRSASANGRLVAVGGAAVIAGFQLIARPDFDYWKHSIYLVYFLAPLAGLLWLRVPQNTGTWRVVAAGTAALTVAVLWSPAILQADQLITFYPNLGPSLATIQQQTADSAQILTDDTALRYYLYPRFSTDRVVGPFYFAYHGQEGLDAYRSAIADRYFDTIVLDGGVAPQGQAIRQQLGQTIAALYQRTYMAQDVNGFTIEVFKPNRPSGSSSLDDAAAPWPVAYNFDTALDQWGGHTEAGDWQPGLQIQLGTDRWEGQTSLEFTPTPTASIVSVRGRQQVTRMRARVYLVPRPDQADSATVHVGFIAFDANWQWHDDAFRWQVPFETWTTNTGDLPQSGVFVEVGLKFPQAVATADIGSFEIDP